MELIIGYNYTSITRVACLANTVMGMSFFIHFIINIYILIVLLLLVCHILRLCFRHSLFDLIYLLIRSLSSISLSAYQFYTYPLFFLLFFFSFICRPTYYSGSHRSLFTVMVYLTDGFTGGNTTVFSDDLSLSYSVPSSLGSCFVMLQRTLHEGSMVQEGIKCALRCDVLYKRVVEEGMDTRKAEEEIVKGMEKKEQAKEWFRLASAVELSGRSNDSIVYYQKAYRLNPLLDEG